MARLSPLTSYTPPAYPSAKGTALGRILLAASMAATSLGGCGPAVDRKTVDSAVDKGDLDAAVDQEAGSDSAKSNSGSSTSRVPAAPTASAK